MRTKRKPSAPTKSSTKREAERRNKKWAGGQQEDSPPFGVNRECWKLMAIPWFEPCLKPSAAWPRLARVSSAGRPRPSEAWIGSSVVLPARPHLTLYLRPSH